MWHMSTVTSEVFFSFVFSFVFLDNMWELVGGGSDINGAYPVFIFSFASEMAKSSTLHWQSCRADWLLPNCLIIIALNYQVPGELKRDRLNRRLRIKGCLPGHLVTGYSATLNHNSRFYS